MRVKRIVIQLCLRVLPFVLGGFGSGCGGSIIIHYRGTVTQSDVTGYAYEETENPKKRLPIKGAHVRFYFPDSEISCETAREYLLYDEQTDEKTTDASGRFEYYHMAVSGPGSRTEMLLCVEHPDYETFEYFRILEEAEETHRDVQFMNIGLKRKESRGFRDGPS